MDRHNAGEFVEAERLYEELLSVHPTNADVLHNLGLVALQLGHADRALRLLQAAVDAAPARADLQAGLGSALVLLQRHREAIELLAPLIERGLDLAGRRNLSIALTRSGQPGAAQRVMTQTAAESDAEHWATLGNICTDAGDWRTATEAYERVLSLRPDDATVWSNRLLMAQYDERLDPSTLLDLHTRFGQRIEGIWPAIPFPFANDRSRDRRLRLGVVSADLGEHPVGYLALPWLQALDASKFELHVYATRTRHDPMQQKFQALAAAWVEVQHLSDDALLAKVREDQVDVLIDLSGHTAGNRLPVFARRAAPVQVSLLGYPATTGLRAIDLRISDAWIDPPDLPCGVEPCVRLAQGVFRYAPPEQAPLPAEPPLLRIGRPSFGVFGNYAKFGPEALVHWAAVLRAVPTARFVLKAAALAEQEQQSRITEALGREGIAADRLVFLPWSDHFQHLSAYQEVDVMLDTLPFNLAGNTCEALWMGVPVLSLAGNRPAGRMGRSLLETAGFRDWACANESELIAQAQALLADPSRLADLRRRMRDRLHASPLLEGQGFAQELGDVIRRAWAQWCDLQPEGSTRTHHVLHVGCGHPEAGKLPPGFDPQQWRELRVDLDPKVHPDFVASIEDLAPVPSHHADALYSSHNVEHLFPSQVPKALQAFHRVLKPGGFALITLPDLQSAAEAILRGELHTPLYQSPAGPVTAHHLIYSYTPFVESGNPFMLHKTGFTADTLAQSLRDAGFERVQVSRHKFALWALGFKPQVDHRP
ncbi:O-linked N-acetylglucosamine transferase family protein [Inhella crocodyli]|uniref:O-linked N-acetylglucosamine transferase family protein n=1 Tax=Inhella crocodyli TaxID=2499851 RepID=UPI001F0C4D8F|nr:tetratricopeptide repeat protein [Inhella crocodyli]